MINIREYFDNLYNEAVTEADWDKVHDYECSVYEMEDGFEEWAKEHNIDLTAVGPHGITVLQYWVWDMEED